MTNFKTVFIANGNGQYESMFQNHGWEITKSPSKATFIQFTGGSDVHPYLYHRGFHKYCGRTEVMRDIIEMKLYYQNPDKIKLGICRGGQFLWVMNGGEMYQDVDHHTGYHHLVDLPTGAEILVTSTHHQMMKDTPNTLGRATIIATAKESTRKYYVDEEGKESTHQGDEIESDIEVAVFKDTRSLCFQPHPEFLLNSTQEYYFELLEREMFPLIKQG